MKVKILLSLVILYSLLLPVFAQKRAVVRNSIAKPIVQTTDNSQVLPIRRVILYSNGVAYVERRGVISGNAEINLSFKQSQVDDVLKSMVVLDLGQGQIGAVSYNSSLPASARTAEIPFSISSQTNNAGGIAGVLSQLQGAKVAVATKTGSVIGSILTVEKRQSIVENNKPPINTQFLVIATDSGELSSFDLDEVKSVKLLEEGTRKDITEFANATASTRRRDAKTITVTSQGNGQREMMVSYTIAAPIWKTTYRVVLDKEGKPFFQGWAIVDNVSDEDWQNVQLSLISGTPISFIQPIQKPMYRYRPIVPIPQDLNLQPQVYEEGGVSSQISVNGSRSRQTNIQVDGVVNTQDASVGNNFSAQQINQLPLNGRNAQNLMNLQPGVTTEKTTISEALTTNRSGITTAATGEELGDLFEYKIEQPITVLRDRSALIPIIQTKMDGERIAIYNETVRRDRPMGGMLLTNTSPLTFEGGSLTVIDRDAYAGEALMERLKPKERRLISFALDLGTLVTVENKGDNEPAKLFKVVNGVFQVHYFQSNKKIYKISNQTDKIKTVYVEYPIRQGWELSSETQKPDITTNRYHRFRVELKPFDKTELVVSEQMPLMDSYQLTSLTGRDLELFISRRYIDEPTKVRLQKLIDLRGQINQIQAKLQALDDEEEKISEDQKRLRENIETLSKTPEAKTLITRYVEKVNTQETRLEAMTKERQNLEADRQKIEADLATEIRNFDLK
ncbi:MAG: hypothetical protein AAB336_01570 [Acidobacteriota bacterium]